MKVTTRNYFKRGILALLACLLLVAEGYAQHADQLMRALGFRKSGTEFLYPISFFPYTCASRQHKPYLVVKEQNLEACREMDNAGKLAYLTGPHLVWEILLPADRKGLPRLTIAMQGKQVTDDRDWQQLASCSKMSKEGMLSLKDTIRKQELLLEALITWREMVSWYRTGKH